MRRLLAVGLILAFCAPLSIVSNAANPTVPATGSYCWTKNTESDLAGYRLALTDASGAVTTADVGLTATPAAPCVPRNNAGMPDGNYSAQVFAYDLAGNRSAGSVAAPFLLDAAPPAAPAGLVVK